MISIGPVSRLIQGDVLDCNKQHLERALRDYDSQLYLKWNPEKNARLGTWELRSRPKKKTAIYQGSFQGMQIYTLEYKELGVENHIKDFDLLGYHILHWVKEHDLWSFLGYSAGNQTKVTNWIDAIDKRSEEIKSEKQAKLRAEAVYNLKQESSAIRDYKDAVASGTNPAALARHWGQLSRQK